MFYQIVKPLTKVALRFFFKHIYWVDYEKVPKGKPVIFAANHPTAFVEPCIMACFADRPLYFLVRGDFFRKPLYAFFLKGLHMLPIFRKKDGGFGDLKNNLKTFSVCSEALAEGKTIMILAEGCAENEKRLRPIQKGTGRLALSTLMEYGDLDLTVVPVGVNYSNSLRWRSEVMINFGDPIPVKDYLPLYLDNAVLAVNQFTQDLEIKMRKLVWHVDDEKWDEKVDQLIYLQQSTTPPSSRYFSNNHLPYRQGFRAIEKWNQLGEEIKEQLSDGIELYWNKLGRGRIQPQLDYSNKFSFGQFTLLVILAPLAFIGFLANAIPAFLAKYICDTKVHNETFYTPVLIAIGTGVYFLLNLGFLAVAIVFQQFWWMFIGPLVWLLGLAFLYWYDVWTVFRSQKEWHNTDDALKAELKAAMIPIKKLLT